jgi:DNA-directed RNA polymerase beta subunit
MNTQQINGYDSDGKFVIENNKYIEDPWTIIESYFNNHHLNRLVRHQLESYNNFVGYQIIKTIEMFNPVHIKSEEDFNETVGKYSLEMFITFENFHIYRPQIHENNGAIKIMFPQEARLRNFTYSSAMTIDINIKYIIRDGENLDIVKTLHKTLPKIHIGKLPIMLKSNICVLNQYNYVDYKNTGECKYDAGGYFIINGSEKTVLGQERAAENRVYCFNISKNETKYTWKAEIKSVPDFKCISPKQINMMISSKNNGFGFPICIEIPRIKQPIPLFILFRALNILSDKNICEYILLDITLDKYKPMLENLQASIIEANKHMTYEDSVKYITSYVSYTPLNMDKETGAIKKRQFTLDVLQNDLFPHCQTIKQKIYFLGYMANKLLQASFEWIKCDDRDSYINKRIDLTGTSLNNLFRNYFNKLVKDMEKQVVKEIKTGSWKSKEDYINIINLTNIYKIIKSNTIENGFKRALSTGDFGIKHANSNKVGVAQVLNRLTYIASLSHLRRVSTPTDKSGKLVPPRKLHSTSWGFLCPAETPEGASVGVVKNMSYMAHITIYSDSNSLYDYIIPNIVKIDNDELTPGFMYDKVKVFINGAWVGVTVEPEELYNNLKDMKHKGIINIYTSIIFNYKLQEIRVCNDSGRITRPLLRVKNNNILLTSKVIQDLKSNELIWDDLLVDCKVDETIIEYVDPEEQSFSMIATKPKDIITNNGVTIIKYTHCEIHPSTIFGVVASCIPYPDHNQSPRNTYQCLDINETVLLSNGSSVPIKDIKIGDEVICFDPLTMMLNYTKVVNQYVRETDKKLFKIKTICGKEIIATDDHKFMTTDGWKQVIDFSENNTFIGLMPTQKSIQNNIKNSYIIIDENSFRNKYIELGIELKYINFQIKKLNEINILPLTSDDYRLPIISRIFGFVLSDGSINIYKKNTKYMSCSFTFGTENDVLHFENDIKICGFNKCKYNYASRSFNGVTHSTYNVTHNGSLPSLLIALGITYGKKTETIRNPVPNWIINGSELVKREFISGFQGGDGCKIRWNKNNKGYNYICAETSQQINPNYTDSLLYFMNQCVDLLREFGIETHINPIVNICENRNKVAFKITDKQENLIKYFDNIGYRYAFTKNIDSFTVIEYLKYKELCFKEHFNLITQVRKLCDEDKSNSYISSELNITVSKVSDIRRSYKNNRKISMCNLKNNNIEEWLTRVKIINGMLFIPIISIQIIENRLVSDITVESDNHSFITSGGILSSNCAQAKQAMGIYATNFNERMDKTAYVLSSPTRPLVDTRLMNLIKLNENPSGCNINVAIMTHTGYNQEDSLLVNKGSIDRGLLQITITHTEKDEDKQKINGDEEIRCKPDPSNTKGMKFGNYNKVNSKGIVPENTLIENRDVIIAKKTPIKENRNDHTKVIKYEDGSKQYKTSEETYIDKNYIDRNGDGYSFAKVRLRCLRKPVIGDKFCALPTQQVLTQIGWVEIQDIDISVHKVATLDVDGNMTYEYPSDKFEYDHNDKMYFVENKQVHIICTLNHKLYVQKRSGKKYELIEAQDVMGKMVRFQKSLKNVNEDIEFMELGDEKYEMDEFLKLLGIFIADGYSHNNIIYITALKERKVDFLNKLLTNMNLSYCYSKDGKFSIYKKNNINLSEFISELSLGALNKHLPEVAFNLSERQSQILLESLLEGDGSSMEYKGETFNRYGTISLQLANDVSRLAVHCGYSGIIKISDEPTGIARVGKRNLGSRAGQVVEITQKHTYYKVSIITKQNQPWINKKQNESNVEKLIDYEGKVYCIEMPSSHTYYMRESTFNPSVLIGNSSRHGQKGTVGNIIPEEDMPFTRNGVRPDIIINPHAIPSRMTIGQLKETLLGKVLVELGLFGDGTSFGELDVDTISKKLLDLGYEAHGNELMYNGLTGEQIECSVFMGPVFYQRLKHMVNDKQHSRSFGPMVNLTRQPAEGRSRDGGLRFGEMEKDAMVSHGASKFTRGRMYDASDKYQVFVCKKCGLIASYNDELHIHCCRTCDNRVDFAYVEIPYACKLLFQELTTMNVVPRIMTDK